MFDIEVTYRHFPLHPDTLTEGLTLQQLFAGRDIDIPAAQARMSQLMAAEGLAYADRTMTYNSRLAQELGKWSDSRADGTTLHKALFEAYFVDNINLARVDNLLEIGQREGMPAEEMRDVLEQRRFQNAVDDDWARSQALGITGVPTFVIGNHGLIGAQPYDRLEALVTSAGAVPRERESEESRETRDDA